jgi:hypothetical protein
MILALIFCGWGSVWLSLPHSSHPNRANTRQQVWLPPSLMLAPKIQTAMFLESENGGA